MKAMPHGVVPAATGEPEIFVSAPVLPIENSLTALYAPLEQLPSPSPLIYEHKTLLSISSRMRPRPPQEEMGRKVRLNKLMTSSNGARAYIVGFVEC